MSNINLEREIKLFALDKGNTSHLLAMLQVGKTAKHNEHEIMSRIIADVLLKFHKIEIKRKGEYDFTGDRSQCS